LLLVAVVGELGLIIPLVVAAAAQVAIEQLLLTQFLVQLPTLWLLEAAAQEEQQVLVLEVTVEQAHSVH
jgi:hypothetical protein